MRQDTAGEPLSVGWRRANEQEKGGEGRPPGPGRTARLPARQPVEPGAAPSGGWGGGGRGAVLLHLPGRSVRPGFTLPGQCLRGHSLGAGAAQGPSAPWKTGTGTAGQGAPEGRAAAASRRHFPESPWQSSAEEKAQWGPGVPGGALTREPDRDPLERKRQGPPFPLRAAGPGRAF